MARQLSPISWPSPWPLGLSPWAIRALEINLPTHLGEPRVDDAAGAQPGGARRAVGLEARQHGRRVERVEDIDADRRAGPAQAHDLGDAEIDLVHAVVRKLPRVQDVDRHVGGAARQW